MASDKLRLNEITKHESREMSEIEELYIGYVISSSITVKTQLIDIILNSITRMYPTSSSGINTRLKEIENQLHSDLMEILKR